MSKNIKLPYRIVRMAKLIDSLEKQLREFRNEFEDDSDSENNAHTNGYFPERPSQEGQEWYLRRYDFVRNMQDRLVSEILKGRNHE